MAYAKKAGDVVLDRKGGQWTVTKLDGEDMTVTNSAGKTWSGYVTDMRLDEGQGDTTPGQSSGRRSRNSQGSTQANKSHWLHR